MFLPIGDTPNPVRFTAYVNWALILANVVVYLLLTVPLSSQGVDPRDPAVQALLRHVLGDGLDPLVALNQLTAYELFVFEHGYISAAPQATDLFSSMFLHGGFWHLAGNMLFLWIYGDNVEHRLGRVGYLVAYLGTGAVATVSFGWLAGPSWTPLVGASGAISGVLGCYFLLFKRNQIKLLVALFPFFFDVILLPARWVLGFYVVVDNMLPFVVGSSSNVAYGAHLGGFCAGLLVAGAGEHLSWRWPWTDAHWRLRSVLPGSPRPRAEVETLVETIRQALVSGHRAEALGLVERLGRAEIAELSPGECVVLSQWLDQASHPIAAANLLRRCLDVHARSGSLARVFLALGLMRLAQGQPTAAYQHLLAVFDHDPDPTTEAEARDALRSIPAYRGRGS
ncbi:MAG: rhomboid family intramembrane serine protease [Pseudomonadota bacterium]